MKKLIVVLSLLIVITLTAARAEISLYIAEGTVSSAQAEMLRRRIEEALGEPVGAILQEDTGESVSQMVLGGGAPDLAVLSAEQGALWARERMLLPLDGCVPELGRMAKEITDACVFDEQLMMSPFLVCRRMMAVRPDRFQSVNMGYLLDERAHPVWYPSEFVQALDEMALLDSPGMDVWLPEEADSLWLEALLQGVSDLHLADAETGAYAADVSSLEDAFEWMEDMLRAELIRAAEDREDALGRFLAGDTAVFVDWTGALSETYAQEIRQGEILIRPYPSIGGAQRHVCELVVVCAFCSPDEQENVKLRQAAAALCGAQEEQFLRWRRGLYDDGAACLPPLDIREYGATLRMLIVQAARDVIAGKMSGEQAAHRIDRAMRTMGWQ